MHKYLYYFRLSLSRCHCELLNRKRPYPSMHNELISCHPNIQAYLFIPSYHIMNISHRRRPPFEHAYVFRIKFKIVQVLWYRRTGAQATRVVPHMLTYRVAQKLAQCLYAIQLPSNTDQFSNIFSTVRIRRKLVIILSLKTLPHLKRVTTP